MFYIIGGIALVVGIIMTIVGINKGKLRAAMSDMETSNIANLSSNMHAEIKGVAQSEPPLTAPGCDIKCVYYSYEVKRLERRRDSNGNMKESWKTVDKGKTESAFMVSDSTGSVEVAPRGAKIDCPVVADRYLSNNDFANGMLGSILNMSGLSPEREKIKVRAIRTDEQLYVLGNVIQVGQTHRIAKGEGKFFISTRSEEELARSLGWQSKLITIIGIGLAIAGAVVLLMTMAGALGK